MVAVASSLLAAGPVHAQPSPQPLTLLEGLSFPAGIAFDSDGTMYFTEREGRIRRVVDGELDPEPVASAATTTSGETGFLGLAVSPPPEEMIYVFATEPDGATNRVLRVERSGGDLEPVVVDIPGGGYHNGGGLAFDGSGALFISNGEIHDGGRAQDPDELGGKIYRVTRDGEPFPNNPFGEDSMTYALGLRNPYGLTIDPISGDPFVTENGPEANDEVNHIRAGANYGWPVVQGEVGDVGRIEATLDGRYVNPLLDYPDIIVPTGIAFAPPGEARASFAGDLFFGTFGERTIHRVALDRSRGVVSDTVLLQEVDPVIAVAWGPRGLYYSTPTTIRLLPLARDDRGEGPGATTPPTGSAGDGPSSPAFRLERVLAALGVALIAAIVVWRVRRARGVATARPDRP